MEQFMYLWISFFFVNNFKQIVSSIRSNSLSRARLFEVEFEKVSCPNKRIQGSKLYLNIDRKDSRKKNPIFVIKNLLPCSRSAITNNKFKFLLILRSRTNYSLYRYGKSWFFEIFKYDKRWTSSRFESFTKQEKKIAFIRVLLLLVLHETTNLSQQIRFRFMNAYWTRSYH